MSRVMHGNMVGHLAGDSITVSNCWELSLRNGTVTRLTNHDQDLVFQGETFESASGFDLSMIETGENLSVSNAEASVLLSASNVTKSDIFAGLYDGARGKVWMVNWQDTADYCSLPGGFLSGVKDSDRGVGVFDLVGLSDKLGKSTGSAMESTCDADVGDTRCGVDLIPYTEAGTVTSVTDNQNFQDSTTARPISYFSYGILTWVTGLNAGHVSEVRIFDGSNFELFSITPSAISVGDTYSASAGCDRTSQTCINKFANIINFRGFNFIPGTVELMSGPK